ncbi:hypothetical protein Tco_1288053, partial [Tanacetum coccineum]
MDVDDEEEEEPLSASLLPLSPLRTPPHVSESSSYYDIPITTTTTVGRPFKGPLSTYDVIEPSSVASSLVFSARYELNQLRQDFNILGSHVQSLTRGMGTRRTEIAEAYKEAIRARRRLEIRLDVASVDRIMPPKRTSNAFIERMIADRVAATLVVEQTVAAAKAAEVARAVAAAETTRVTATAGSVEGSNNAGPAAGAGGPNVAG